MMNDWTLYKSALESLNSRTSGAEDFQSICHILAKKMYPDFYFHIPEGGRGTQDGGYDGRDQLHNAKIACSIDKRYPEKIKSELTKSKKHGDKTVMYFSNQKIPESKKEIPIADARREYDIELEIHGIDDLANTIDDYLRTAPDARLYDLLRLSSLTNGVRYKRGDIFKQPLKYDGENYFKKISFINGSWQPAIIDYNPLFIYIHKSLQTNNLWDNFPNIFLSGIGNIGKSFAIKTTINSLIDEFSNTEKITGQYGPVPFIKYYELKNYKEGIIEAEITNSLEPLLIFLDGLDEITTDKQIDLSHEISRSFEKSQRIRFLVAGRDSVFSEIETCFGAENDSTFKRYISLRIEKYTDWEDESLHKLIRKYSKTPIAELVPIPFYRNHIKSQPNYTYKSIADLTKGIVKNAIDEDNRRDNSANNKSLKESPRYNIDEIMELLSKICLDAFAKNKYKITDEIIRKRVTDDNLFLYITKLSIIDYKNENDITFISRFYYEYFAAMAASKLCLIEMRKMFFIKGKPDIHKLDVFTIVLNLLAKKNYLNYRSIVFLARRGFVDFPLICDFEIFPDKIRYQYFSTIYSSFNKKRNFIFYGHMGREYNILKNIENPAMRMQEFLPNSYKDIVLNHFIKEIRRYINHQNIRKIALFANSIILITPFSGEAWNDKQQELIKKIAMPLINFFLAESETRNRLKGLLSARFILGWYHNCNWTKTWTTKDWNDFISKILGADSDLLDEIKNSNEFALKSILFCNFNSNNYLLPIVEPLLKYIINNFSPVDYGTFEAVPEIIRDEDIIPVKRIDNNNTWFYYVLEQVNIPIDIIVRVLAFATQIPATPDYFPFHEKPITILENKLFTNIEQIISDIDLYEPFSKYLFTSESAQNLLRFFDRAIETAFDQLKMWLLDKLYDMEMQCPRFIIGHLIAGLLDLTIQEVALLKLFETEKYLNSHNQAIYMDIIYLIYHSSGHILYNTEKINEDYNKFFSQEIKEQELLKAMHTKAQIEIEKKQDEEILLFFDDSMMEKEICAIIDHLNTVSSKEIANTAIIANKTSRAFVSGDKSLFVKIAKLMPEHLLRNLEYYHGKTISEYKIFSECALQYVSNCLRSVDEKENISDNLRNRILEDFRNWSKKPFYIYFYTFYIEAKLVSNRIDIIHNIIKKNEKIKQKIKTSLNEDAKERFEHESIECFDNNNNHLWVNPFLFYMDALFDGNLPKWLNEENTLKMLACTRVAMSTNLNFEWFNKLVRNTISEEKIVCYTLDNISKIKGQMSRIQIFQYLVQIFSTTDKDNVRSNIVKFIIDQTKNMFDSKNRDSNAGEYSVISTFWYQNKDNSHIDSLFPCFTCELVISAISSIEKDINAMYRKQTLEYVIKIASKSQREKIIKDIKEDMFHFAPTGEQAIVISHFLAGMGDEESISHIIIGYQTEKKIVSNEVFVDNFLGVLEPSTKLLNQYIDLFLFSMDSETEGYNMFRTNLYNLSITGIRQHLTQANYHILKTKLEKRIKYFRKRNYSSSWLEEYLQEMEQIVWGYADTIR